jgi:hypothetical protein
MPGIKYYLRQANAFLSLAQSTTDAPLRERYRMMAERFRGMASEERQHSAAGGGTRDRLPRRGVDITDFGMSGEGSAKPRNVSTASYQEGIMNEDALNMSVRKFLKKVGVTSQREIEDAVRLAVISGQIKGNEMLPARVKLTVDGIKLAVEIEGSVELE